MRVLLAGMAGFFTWSLSIVFIPVGPVTSQDTQPVCGLDDVTNHVIQDHMEQGVVFQIYNDGQTLWANLTPRWTSLDDRAKTLLYNSLVCLARKQGLPLHVLLTE